MTPHNKKSKPTTYVIPGDPAVLARVFWVGRALEEQKHVKMNTINTLENIHNDAPLLTGPLHLHAVFYMPTLKKSPEFHTSKPHLSQLVRFIEDICVGILYKDECLIVSMCTEKRYDDEPRTEFTLESINE
jgi:Holliday junction resolvase RusA-like endonuclease